MLISCNPKEGNIFSIQYKSKGISEYSLYNQNKQEYNTSFEGETLEKCFIDEENFITYFIDFKNTKIQINGDKIEDNNEQNSNENSEIKNVYIKISKYGEIIEIKFNNKLNPNITNFYRDYIANSFVNFKNYTSKSKSWINSINNYSGKTTYEYRIISDNKIKRKYIATNPVEKTYILNQIKNVSLVYSKEARTIFQISEKNIPEIVDLNRNFKSYIDNKIISDEETIFTKKLLNKKKLSVARINDMNFSDFYTTDLKALEVEKRLKEKTLLQNLYFIKFDDFLSYSDLKNFDKYTDYFQKLKSLFSLLENTIPSATAFLESHPNSNQEFNLVLSALVSSGSPQAQKALIEVYPKIKNINSQLVLMANLATVEHPSLATENFINSYLNDNNSDIKSTALLALGNMGKSLQSSDVIRADKIYNQLIDKLNKTNDDFEKQVTLLSLGNLSDSRSLQNIYQELQSPKTEIRKSAAFALRFIDRQEPEQYLQTIIEKDSSETVILSALEALSYRKPNQDIISIEKKILHSHPSETLRMQSLKNLSLTGIKEEIEYAAQNDSSKAVRDFAKNLLVRYEINL